jgi:hypothetical protein
MADADSTRTASEKQARARYAIRCTPGGLLRDDSTGDIICFDSYAEVEAEALRLTQAAYGNPRMAGLQTDFTPVLHPGATA